MLKLKIVYVFTLFTITSQLTLADAFGTLSAEEYMVGVSQYDLNYYEAHTFSEKEAKVFEESIQNARELWDLGYKNLAVNIYANTLAQLNAACASTKDNRFACHFRDNFKTEAMDHILLFKVRKNTLGDHHNKMNVQQNNYERCNSFRNKYLKLLADYDC
ncbi:MAG: hypothetical protein H6625_09680 [Bdellovibrionaceae bacterium]|nr:hypothetical protein [Pseudobdellovibrionaceae bacterium]